MTLANLAIGDRLVTLRRATVDDVPAIISLIAADQLATSRGDSARPGGLRGIRAGLPPHRRRRLPAPRRRGRARRPGHRHHAADVHPRVVSRRVDPQP